MDLMKIYFILPLSSIDVKRFLVKFVETWESYVAQLYSFKELTRT